jgi:hypothetical protein
MRYTGLTNGFLARILLEGSKATWNIARTIWNSLQCLQPIDHDTRFWQKYSIGANWYPLRRLNFSAEYYHKQRNNDYEHISDSTPNLPTSLFLYPAFLRAHDVTADDVNFRATWRPLTSLTLVGRYDFQLSTIETQPDNFPQTQTSEMTSHIVSGSINWTPLPRLYLLGGINWVWDQTETPADAITPALQKSENNYWTVNASVGFVLDEKDGLGNAICLLSGRQLHR